MIEIVSATRLSEDEFWQKSALGLSLRRLKQPDSRLVPRVSFANARGLPEVYNARILAAEGEEILVFMHDDVWIDDYFFPDRIIEGLQRYDVIGVAGNRRRLPGQVAWNFLVDGADLVWDDKAHFSGAVAHGKTPFGGIAFYGPTPADCELLDGVCLAANKAVLRRAQAQFDPRFAFHFYDMDFCRSARQKGLRLGTWPICLTHQSGGAFGTDAWNAQYRQYLAKWPD